MAKVKLKDIADAMNVSVVTVSNALSGKKGVSENTRRAIMGKARELGFDLSRYEKQEERDSTIGIFVSRRYISVGTSFYWEMYEKTAYAASRRHCFTMLEISSGESEDSPLPRLLFSGQLDAMIIIGKIEDGFLRRILDAADIPVVLLDFYRPEYGCDAVLSNNYIGMYRATEYLVDHGYRDIGFVGTGITSKNVIERFFGYRKCLIEHDLTMNPGYIIHDRDTDTEEVTLRLPEKIPNAFACSSDYAAGFLIRELEKRGLRVPEDVAVTSYDHYISAGIISQTLTTYNVDMDRMAKAAVKMAVRKIKGDRTLRGVRYIDSSMIEGDTVRNV